MYVVTFSFKPSNRLISTTLDDVEGLSGSGFPILIYVPWAMDWSSAAGMIAWNQWWTMRSSIDCSMASGSQVQWSKSHKWVFNERSREALFADLGVRVLYWLFEKSSFLIGNSRRWQCEMDQSPWSAWRGKLRIETHENNVVAHSSSLLHIPNSTYRSRLNLLFHIAYLCHYYTSIYCDTVRIWINNPSTPSHLIPAP